MTKLEDIFGAPFVHVDLGPTAEDFANLPEGMSQTIWHPPGETTVDLRDGAVGYLSVIFLKGDPRPAKEQIEERYAHGGGWYTNDDWAKNFTVGMDGKTLHYPGDAPFHAIAYTTLDSGETVTLFEGSFVRISNPVDASYVITRMD